MIFINIPAKMGRSLSRFVAIPSWNMWKKKMMTTQMEMIKTQKEREREEYIHECAECKSVGVTHQPPTSIRSDPSGRHTHTHTNNMATFRPPFGPFK
jgi:hypothetical protein